MATTKRKKSSPRSSLSVALPDAVQVVSPQFLPLTADPLDDEPKVSFTLEFYPVDEKESSFIGRLKKIGSEEQATLIDDLDSEVLLDFIRRNLPKNWRKQDFNETIAKVETEAETVPIVTLPLQNQVNEPTFETESPIKELPTGKLEIWQNGLKSNVFESSQAISLRFATDSVAQWAEYNVHFKSLERSAYSHNIRRKQILNGQLEVFLSEDQLKPGIYDLKFSALAAGDNPINGAARFTANQLIQVI
ncbi:hypothetical protein [Haliscomenobacter sp.]|uniref:hypothetical protein n=1 Tax=Haliscomenobacter sp. TaxID=2717303 RepID=UPI003BAABC27